MKREKNSLWEGPGLVEGTKEELLATCHALRDHLCATRVAVWRYYPDIAAISPFVASVADQSSMSAEIGARWMYTPLADLPPIEDTLTRGRAARICPSELTQGRVKELFEDFEVSSAWCGRLLLGRPLGVVVVEPAEAVPDRLDPKTRDGVLYSK